MTPGLVARLAARTRGGDGGAVRVLAPSPYLPARVAAWEIEEEIVATAPPAVASPRASAPVIEARRAAAPRAITAIAAPPATASPPSSPPVAASRSPRAIAAPAVAPSPAIAHEVAITHETPGAPVTAVARALEPRLPSRTEPDPRDVEDAPLVPTHADARAPVTEPIVATHAARERSAPSRRASRTAERGAEVESVVRVTIGRIDVRAVSEPASKPRAPSRRPAAPGLAEYLDRRDRGGSGGDR